MFCRKCGKEIPDDSEFCNKCGTPTGVQPAASGNSRLWDYNDAVNKMNSAKSLEDFDAAEKILESLGDFKDSKELLEKCRENKTRTVYDNAVQALDHAKSVEEFDRIEKIFESLGDFKDSKDLLKKCREERIPAIYESAVKKMNNASCAEDFETAEKSFASLNGYKDSDELLKKCGYNKKLWIYNDGYKMMNSANTIDEHKAAAEIFASLSGFEDADTLRAQCLERANEIIYVGALDKMKRAVRSEQYDEAAQIFRSINGYKDADDLAEKCKYNSKAFVYNDALKKLRDARYGNELKAIADVFRSLGDFKDAKLMAERCEGSIAQHELYKKQEEICRNYNKALTALECSSDVYALQEARKKFLSLGDIGEAPQLAKECEEKIDCVKANKPYTAKRHSSLKPEEFKSANIKSPEKATLADGTIPKDNTDGRVSSHVILEKSNGKPAGKSYNEQEKDAVYNNALLKLESSNDSYTLQKAREAFVSLCDYRDSEAMARKCQEKINNINNISGDKIQLCSQCGTTLHSWHSRCPKCGKPKPGAYQIDNASPQTSQQNSFEEDYHYLKIVTGIGAWIIMGVVIIFLFVTGQFANLACAGCLEYSVEYTYTGMSTLLGWAVGVAVTRGIILLCYKAANRMK